MIVGSLACSSFVTMAVLPAATQAFVTVKPVSYWGGTTANTASACGQRMETAARRGSQDGGWDYGRQNNYNRDHPGFGPGGRRKKTRARNRQKAGGSNSTVGSSTLTKTLLDIDDDPPTSVRERELQRRVTNLESLVASQTVEIKRLKDNVKDLIEAVEAFSGVIELLKQAGLHPPQSEVDDDDDNVEDDNESGEDDGVATGDSAIVLADDNSAPPGAQVRPKNKDRTPVIKAELLLDDDDIFGKAPASLLEAADVAGAAILAGMLGGKQRMLVDVRDAELNKESETLVQFIELAILPVAGAYFLSQLYSGALLALYLCLFRTCFSRAFLSLLSVILSWPGRFEIQA